MALKNPVVSVTSNSLLRNCETHHLISEDMSRTQHISLIHFVKFLLHKLCFRIHTESTSFWELQIKDLLQCSVLESFIQTNKQKYFLNIFSSDLAEILFCKDLINGQIHSISVTLSQVIEIS